MKMKEKTNAILQIVIITFILGMILGGILQNSATKKEIEEDIVNNCFVTEEDELCYINTCKDNEWICIDENGGKKLPS